MAWFRDIQPLGEPFDLGMLDDAGRAQCSFNVMVTKRPSAELAKELLGILVAAGVGQENVNLFGTSAAVIPTGPGPYLSIRPGGGAGPLGTHNDGVGAYRRPSAMILVRAKTYAAAEAMAQAAYNALIEVRNREVTA